MTSTAWAKLEETATLNIKNLKHLWFNIKIQFLLREYAYSLHCENQTLYRGKKFEKKKTRCVGKIANILDDKMWCYIKEPLGFKDLCGKRASNKDI